MDSDEAQSLLSESRAQCRDNDVGDHETHNIHHSDQETRGASNKVPPPQGPPPPYFQTYGHPSQFSPLSSDGGLSDPGPDAGWQDLGPQARWNSPGPPAGRMNPYVQAGWRGPGQYEAGRSSEQVAGTRGLEQQAGWSGHVQQAGWSGREQQVAGTRGVEQEAEWKDFERQRNCMAHPQGSHVYPPSAVAPRQSYQNYGVQHSYPQQGNSSTQCQQGQYYGSMENNSVVVSQPMLNSSYVKPPPDVTVQAILACVLCCWLTGIFAIIKAIEARDAGRVGDMESAKRSAQSAKRMIGITIGLGLIFNIISALLLIFVFTSEPESW